MIALKKMWKTPYFKTAIAIILLIAFVFGFFFGLQWGLHTSYPLLTVESGSMCVPYDAKCDGWLSINHPFAQTLHKGDIIVVQGLNPKDLNANYPNSDIIIYHDPEDQNTLIVHRIVSKQEINGTWYFQTKGDGNGQPWPAIPSPSEYDGHSIWTSDKYSNTGIPQNYVVGKVVMRIPWFGWSTLLLRNTSWGLPLIITLILLLVVFEFVVPILRKKNPHNSGIIKK